MRKLCAIFTASFAFLSGKIFAEERTFSGKIIVGDSSENSYSDSSEANRQKLGFTLGLSRTESFVAINIGYYWNPDSLIEIDQRIYSDSGSYLSNSDDWYRDEIATGIKNYLFFKNLWVFAYGLYYRTARYSQKYYYVNDNTESFELRIKKRDLAAQFSLGTRWQWSTFYLGVDWIAYEITLNNFSSSAETEDLNPGREPSSADDLLAFAKSRSKGINSESVIFTNIKFGFAF